MRGFSCLLIGVAFCAHINAAVLDFESVANDETWSFRSDYLEDGYRVEDVTSIAGLAVIGYEDDRYSGSTSLANNNINGLTRLSRVDGGTFSLLSIELSEIFANETPSVTFISNFGRQQTFTLDGAGPSPETFFFDGFFADITSVTWRQGNSNVPGHQFDNIVTSEVPLPASGALFLFGAGMLSLVRSLGLRG